MTYKEMKSIFREHERVRDATTKPLVGYIVFTKDSFDKEYSEESRTYEVYWYMSEEKGGKNGWKVEKCYLKEGTN